MLNAVPSLVSRAPHRRSLGIASRKRHSLYGMLAGYVVAGVASTVSSDGSDVVASLNMMMHLPPALLGGALIGDIVYRARRDRAQKRRTQPTALDGACRPSTPTTFILGPYGFDVSQDGRSRSEGSYSSSITNTATWLTVATLSSHRTPARAAGVSSAENPRRAVHTWRGVKS